MFHVSTCLPTTLEEGIYLLKKKHIGNDVVVIIFLDGSETSFCPDQMISKFNQVFIVVQPVEDREGKQYYKVSCTHRVGMEPGEPVFPKDVVFEKNPITRRLLLTKSILYNTL